MAAVRQGVEQSCAAARNKGQGTTTWGPKYRVYKQEQGASRSVRLSPRPPGEVERRRGERKGGGRVVVG